MAKSFTKTTGTTYTTKNNKNVVTGTLNTSTGKTTNVAGKVSSGKVVYSKRKLARQNP